MEWNQEFEDSFFKTLFETATEGLVLTDDAGAIRMLNPKALELFGYDNGELIGKEVEILIPDRYKQGHYPLRDNYYNHPRKRPHGVGVEVSGLRKDGTTFPVEISLNYFKWKDQLFVMALVADITIRKQKEKEVKALALEKEQLKNENVKAQLDILKNQVNPHFLFNSLNTLSSLVDSSPEKAGEFIDELSSVYRYVLEVREEQLVTLQEELDFIHSFLVLQKIRFGEALKINIEANDQEALQKLLPSLSLQLLVENAIKHNIASRSKPLQIKIFPEYGSLNVWNNLQPKLDVISTGIGLQNLKARYQFYAEVEPEFIKNSDYYLARLPLISV